MAKKMALVPESWLSTRLNSEGNQTNPQAQIVIADTGEESYDKVSGLADLLPKHLRNKARMLLHYLNSQLKLDNQQRVIYGDGSVGSHIIDLVRYNISPFVKARPLDAPKFAKLMQTAGVPNAAIAKKTNKDDLISNWMVYK